MKLNIGDVIAPRKLRTVLDLPIDLPDRSAPFTHVQFRRWSGCPICNTHLAAFRRHSGPIDKAGIREIIFFHSRPEEIAAFQSDLPFDMVGDPSKAVYRAFGVEASWWRFALSPKALWAALRGLAALRFNLNMRNGPHGLPADFLISPDGRIVAVKYGTHAYDQWSADELLALAKTNATVAKNSDQLAAA